jgi:hypothetical protein
VEPREFVDEEDGLRPELDLVQQILDLRLAVGIIASGHLHPGGARVVDRHRVRVKRHVLLDLALADDDLLNLAAGDRCVLASWIGCDRCGIGAKRVGDFLLGSSAVAAGAVVGTTATAE